MRSAPVLLLLSLVTLPLLAEADETCFETFCCEDASCSECDCLVTCETLGTFRGGGSWLYMRPLAHASPYARVIGEEIGTAVFLQGENHSVPTAFSSGYELFVSYESAPCGPGEMFDCCFPGASFDLFGRFTSHSSSSKDAISVEFPDNEILPLVGYPLNIIANAFLSAESKLEYDYKEIVAEIGGNFYLNPFSFRVGGGVAFAQIDRDQRGLYFDPVTPSIIGPQTTTSALQRGRCSGVGPRISLQAQVDFSWNFAAVFDFGTNLLFANKTNKLVESSLIGQTQAVTFTPIFLEEKFLKAKVVVPSIDLKLGLEFKLDCFCFFSLAIEGGYRTLRYFDPLEQIHLIGQIIREDFLPTGYRDSAISFQTEDYGLSGWYLGGSLVF